MEDVDKRLLDTEQRIADMDRCGFETAVISLTSPGAQSLLDVKQALDFARQSNDHIAEHFAGKQPKRLKAFATVALQSPKSTADELERAIKEHSRLGALINGYSNTGGANTAQYLDEPPVWEFWDRLSALNVPVYLPPREPLPN